MSGARRNLRKLVRKPGVQLRGHRNGLLLPQSFSLVGIKALILGLSLDVVQRPIERQRFARDRRTVCRKRHKCEVLIELLFAGIRTKAPVCFSRMLFSSFFAPTTFV